MLNKNVINILNEVSGITNSIILKYPTTIANNVASDMLITFNMEELDPEEFEDIGINDLQVFLSTFKLFSEDRNVTIKDRLITIDDASTSLQYISDHLHLLADYDKSISIFEKTENAPTVAEFNLSADDIKKMKQASGIFKDLSEIIVESQDGEVNLSLSASNRFNAKSNTFSINKSANTSKEFKISLPIDNFKSLPSSDYTVSVKFSNGKYRVLLNSTELEDFKVLMAISK